MKKTLFTFRVLFVSFEFLLISLCLLSLMYFPDEFNLIASHIESNKDIMKYLTFIPAGLFVWVIKEAQGLLFPGDKYNKILQKWPDYWKLRIHFFIAIFYSIIFMILGLSVWLFALNINSRYGFAILLVSIVGGFIDVTSVYLGKIKQKEILTRLNV